MIDIKRDIVGKKPHWMKDSDRDGIINPIDCKPYNKNEQGVMHRLAASVADRFGATDKAEAIRDRGEKVDRIRSERKEDRKAEAEQYRQERRKIRSEAVTAGLQKEKEEAIKTAEYSATHRAEKQRDFIKGGGYVGQISRGLSTGVKKVQKMSQAQPRPMYSTKRVRVKTGKGKKAKYKYVTKKVKNPLKAQAPKEMPDIFGANKIKSNGKSFDNMKWY